jgi:hypothetical protein
MSLKDFIQDPQEILRLSPQELGAYIIQDLQQEKGFFAPVNYVLGVGQHQFPDFAQRDELQEAVAEAIAWLTSEALLRLDFTESTGRFYKLSKRARQLKEPADINKLARVRETLPKAFLHPIIAHFKRSNR